MLSPSDLLLPEGCSVGCERERDFTSFFVRCGAPTRSMSVVVGESVTGRCQPGDDKASLLGPSRLGGEELTGMATLGQLDPHRGGSEHIRWS